MAHPALTPTEVADIRSRYTPRLTIADLATRYGVAERTIHHHLAAPYRHRHGNSKLTGAQYRVLLLRLMQRGPTVADLAAEYHVSKGVIRRVVTGQPPYDYELRGILQSH